MNVQPSRSFHASIVGASQGIGLGFVKALLQGDRYATVYATYRQAESASELLSLEQDWPRKLVCLPLDITEEAQIAASAKRLKADVGRLHLVINCAGFLHEGSIKPEKGLSQIDPANLLRYFQVNSIGTVLLAKHWLPLFRHSDRSVFASISAKVGSIGDNRLGGWYGYRASKTALNMFVRTIAIEYSRKSPKTIAVALHPGTTDTRLSQPFQQNVPPEKLFSVERTVQQLLAVIDGLQEKDSGEFLSWDGSRLPW
jgi:NAD(P)-dependent dehydrogenase (short-subunit alcohol dehydrogenase family)